MALCLYTTIYFVYIVSHVRTDFLTIIYELLNYCDLSYDAITYESNAVYLTLYVLLWPFTTLCHILFHSTIFLYFLVHMFVLYLLCGCLILNTFVLCYLLWSKLCLSVTIGHVQMHDFVYWINDFPSLIQPN